MLEIKRCIFFLIVQSVVVHMHVNVHGVYWRAVTLTRTKSNFPLGFHPIFKSFLHAQRDTVSYGTALTCTLLLSVWKEFTSTRNQMYASATPRNPLQSCLVFHSIIDLLQKTSFWANFNSSYDIILSYLVKNSIQRNMNRRGEKRVGARRKKSLSFTKITKEMNQ